MFESRLVDTFSRTHWSAVPILYVPLTLVLITYSVTQVHETWRWVAGLFAAGLLSWTFAEYWLHRLLFHWQPAGAFGERMHFILHGVHHKWPRDRFRLVMPPAASLVLFWVFLGLWALLLGTHAYAFHAGFVAGYIFYDLNHYYMHHGHPTSAFLKALRKHHMVHHSPNLEHEKKFGVSTTLWDHVFGTYTES